LTISTPATSVAAHAALISALVAVHPIGVSASAALLIVSASATGAALFHAATLPATTRASTAPLSLNRLKCNQARTEQHYRHDEWGTNFFERTHSVLS
jgi:hypothetical protein